MAENQKTVLTEEGLKKLEAQLDYLISVRRNEVSEQIAVARGFGDLSENAEGSNRDHRDPRGRAALRGAGDQALTRRRIQSTLRCPF